MHAVSQCKEVTRLSMQTSCPLLMIKKPVYDLFCLYNNREQKSDPQTGFKTNFIQQPCALSAVSTGPVSSGSLC